MNEEFDKLFEMKDLFTKASRVKDFLLCDFIKKDKRLLLEIENFLEDKIDKKLFNDFIEEEEKMLIKKIEDCNECWKLIKNIHKGKKWREKIRNFIDKNGNSCLIYAIKNNILVTQELIDNSN